MQIISTYSLCPYACGTIILRVLTLIMNLTNIACSMIYTINFIQIQILWYNLPDIINVLVVKLMVKLRPSNTHAPPK
jgi:hypothetical protein